MAQLEFATVTGQGMGQKSRRPATTTVGVFRFLTVLALAGMLIATAVLQAVAAPPANPHFEKTWARTDQPVKSGLVSRTWMWGPEAFSGSMSEPYAEAPGGMREVQYFDKSRMEITNPDGDQNSPWYVTNGLLVVELVTGKLQLGDNSFEQHNPALGNVAGDQDDPNGPTYATIALLLDEPALPDGATITQRVDRDGNITNDPSLASYGVTAAHHVVVPGIDHQVASPFWAFVQSSGTVYENGVYGIDRLFESDFYATGLPITEAYWTRVTVNGEPRDVLVQVFERRVLTYTPDNEPAWQVEAGNVGRHYYQWRYGVSAPEEPPATPAGTQSIGPTPLPSFFDNGGRTRLTIANHAPQPLTVTLQGPDPRTIDLPPCEGCQSTNQPPSTCSPDAPTASVDIAPGTYLVTSSRPTGNVQPLSGPWTFAPNAGYGACFFVVTDG